MGENQITPWIYYRWCLEVYNPTECRILLLFEEGTTVVGETGNFYSE